MKFNVEWQHEYRETHKNLSAEYMRKYRKRKAQENKTPQASTSTDLHQLQLCTFVMKPMNTIRRMLLVIHLVMPVTYVIDYGVWMI
jgi:hypothetical protein